MSRIRNFVEPFDLTLPYVLEMIKLVPPMQDVHGGVSIEKANGPDDLQFLMLAYLKQDKNDELRLEVNGTVEDTTSVKEGKETEDTPLYLAPGLLRKGLNRVRILIKRISGNEEATPELVLFYKTSPPGDTPPVMNLSLNHRTIDAANADDVYATVDYNNSQDHDKIFISCNGVIVEHTRLPGDPSPLRIHIPKMKLIEGGVSKTFPFKFRVVDYVRNPSGPPTWSDIVTADVDWNRVSLSPPFLVDPSLNPIDLLKGEQVVTVRVQFDSSIPGQKARLVERYPLPGSSLFAPIEFNQNHRANFKLETSFLVKRRGGPCGLYWELMDGDDVIGESPDLVLDILPIKEDDPRLPTPTIAGVTGPVLEVSALTDPVLVESTQWPLQKRDQALWVTLVGIDKDGKTVSLVVRAGEPNKSTEGFSVDVALEWFEELQDLSEVKAICAVSLDGNLDETKAVRLPSRAYKISALAEIVPEILQIKDSIRDDIANGETTADTTLIFSGKASNNREIQLYDSDTKIGPVILVSANGTWRQEIAALHLKSHSITAKAQYGGEASSTPPRTFTVVDYVHENFDQLPQGNATETPVMFIHGALFISTTMQSFPVKPGKSLTLSSTDPKNCTMTLKSHYKRITLLMHTILSTAPLQILLFNDQDMVGSYQYPYITGSTTKKFDFPIAAGFNQIQFKWSNSGYSTQTQIDDVRLYK